MNNDEGPFTAKIVGKKTSKLKKQASHIECFVNHLYENDSEELSEEALLNHLNSLKASSEALNNGNGLKICRNPTSMRISENAIFHYLKSFGWTDEQIQKAMEAMIKSRKED